MHKNRIGIITEKQLYKGHKLGFAKYIKLRVINIFWEIYDEKRLLYLLGILYLLAIEYSCDIASGISLHHLCVVRWCILYVCEADVTSEKEHYK